MTLDHLADRIHPVDTDLAAFKGPASTEEGTERRQPL